MGTPCVASTLHTLYLPLTATPTSSPRLPYIPFLHSPPSLLLHLFYPKKRLWKFRRMIHGLDRWLMDALSSVRTRKLAPPGRKSQIPPLRFRPHHKICLQRRNTVSPLHHDKIPHAGAPDVDRASCLREVVDKEQRTRSWQYRTNMKH